MIDAAVTVVDPEKSGIAPSQPPTVFTDPALRRIVIADNADTVSAGQITGHMVIDAGAIGEEIVIDGEACAERAASGEPGFHLIKIADGMKTGNSHGAVLPVRAEMGAILIARSIRIASLVGNSRLIEALHGFIGPPAVIAVSPLAARMTIEQLRLREVYLVIGALLNDTQSAFNGGDGSKGHTGTAG